MKIIDAFWEKENIGSNALEIVVEKDDVPTDYDFSNVPPTHDYIVVKVPVNKTDFNWVLGKAGYTMIETQARLSINLKDFDVNDRYLKRLLPSVSYRVVQSESELKLLLSRITSEMFLTDRITLDPVFGPEKGCNRYKKYIQSSFDKNTAEIISIYVKGQLVGFEMYSVVEDSCFGKLGGIFSDVNIPGIGFLVACAPLLFTSERYGVTKFYPDISTNNLPVLALYNYFHFHIESLTYVFVKHNF